MKNPRRLQLVMCATLGSLLLSACGPASSEPLRILPLGDSITQGNASTRSYRYNLWKKLVDANIDFDLVGTLNTSVDGKNADWPDYKGRSFDRDHEGRWGWYTDLFLQQGNLAAWLKKYTPDIVLLHLGTNDVFRESPTGETVVKLRKIIELLQADNTKVAILLAKITGSTSKRNPQIVELNREMEALAAAASTRTSRVIVVDQNTGFDPTPGANTYDGTHPNAAGEEKMAQRWFDTIMKIVVPKPTAVR